MMGGGRGNFLIFMLYLFYNIFLGGVHMERRVRVRRMIAWHGERGYMNEATSWAGVKGACMDNNDNGEDGDGRIVKGLWSTP
jgi:hypothetical protein